MWCCILIAIVIIFLIWIKPKESYTITPKLLKDLQLAKVMPGVPKGNYLYYPYMGYDGQMLMQRMDLNGDHLGLMNACNGLPNCVAFDSGGKLYSRLIPRSMFSCTFPTPTEGLFVKQYLPLV